MTQAFSLIDIKLHFVFALWEAQWLKIYKVPIRDEAEPKISLNRWRVITTVQLHTQTLAQLLKCSWHPVDMLNI